MSQAFVERRRSGPVNRLRRMLYGLLLGSASAPALAASPQDAGTLHRLPQVVSNAPLWMHDNALLARDPQNGGLYAYAGLGTVLARAGSLGRDFAFLPVGDLLFTAHFLGDDLKKIGKGLGVDFVLPEFGYFHLNLYTGRNDATGGKRWRIDPQGFALPDSAEHLWSLGGSLAMEQGANGHRQLTFVPQLVLNLDAITRTSGRMQAVISYHNWRSQVDRMPTDQGAVPQVSLKWRF
jgi:hypothetical protein